MALVRILIDGYSLLYGWPEIAPSKPRHSAAARDELIHHLTRYHDAAGIPLTIVFDGANNDIRLSTVESTPQVEILYSRADQTADQIIERVTHRLSAYGEVLAVTDDNAERDTVIAMGGMASSCLSFIQTVESALAEMRDDIKVHNRSERTRFKRSK
jgi:predicted RNA-binding protein with PIN domain